MSRGHGGPRVPAWCVALLLCGGMGIAGPALSQAPTAGGGPGVLVGKDPVLDRALAAARAGKPLAEYRLARLYKARKDDSGYFDWLRRAAEQGLAKAQDALGFDYALGQGVRQNYRKSVRWYGRAAAQGDPDAECELGLDYAFGLGVPKNRGRAVRFYREAAADGYQPAKTLLPY